LSKRYNSISLSLDILYHSGQNILVLFSMCKLLISPRENLRPW
jgi:hypothetical protein